MCSLPPNYSCMLCTSLFVKLMQGYQGLDERALASRQEGKEEEEQEEEEEEEEEVKTGLSVNRVTQAVM